MTNPNPPSIEAPFLRSSWDFPDDNSQVLAVQVSRSFLAIANNMNARTIALFPQNGPIATGESWFISGAQYSGQRQFYTFTTTANIPHGINLAAIESFTKCFGSYTDGTNWYGLVYGSNVSVNGQLSFYITGNNIVFVTGSGSPSPSFGVVCLEWISQV